MNPPDSIEWPTVVYVCFNHRSDDDWDTWRVESSFVPRVGDSLWIPELKSDRTVARVTIELPNAGADTPRVVAHVHVQDPM